MYFNQSNIIILFAILLFSTYLILPQPIILIEKNIIYHLINLMFVIIVFRIKKYFYYLFINNV